MSTKKNMKEIANLSKDELVSKLREVESQLFHARIQAVTGQLKDSATTWKLRKQIARMKTVANEKAKRS